MPDYHRWNNGEDEGDSFWPVLAAFGVLGLAVVIVGGFFLAIFSH